MGKPHTPESELYAFGLLLYHMHTLQEPFAELDISGSNDLARLVAENNLRPNLPASLPAALQELMQDLWHGNPSRRPAWSEGDAPPCPRMLLQPRCCVPALPSQARVRVARRRHPRAAHRAARHAVGKPFAGAAAAEGQGSCVGRPTPPRGG